MGLPETKMVTIHVKNMQSLTRWQVTDGGCWLSLSETGYKELCGAARKTSLLVVWSLADCCD